MADDVGVVNGQNAVVIAHDRDRAIREYAVPIFNEPNPGIVRPEIQAPQFELKPVMFQMLQTVGQFSGMPTEDPHLHLRLFIEVSDSFKLPGVTENALRLKLFPYSLRDRARAWLNSLPSNSVTTWQELAENFLMKYFPPTKNAKLRNEITAFQQVDEESLYEAWERFKELLRKCPHHGIPHCIQMETFYNGLNAYTRMVVDASANGAILAKSYNEAYEILERISNNNYQWPTTRASIGRKVTGIHEVEALTSLAAEVSSMSNMLKTISMGMGPQMGQLAEVSCVYYVSRSTFVLLSIMPRAKKKGRKLKDCPRFISDEAEEHFEEQLKNKKLLLEKGFHMQDSPSLGLPSYVSEVIVQQVTEEQINEALQLTTKEGTQWIVSTTEKRTVMRTALTPAARVWYHFIKFCLRPTTHDDTVSQSKILLIYALLIGLSINIGRIILAEMRKCISKAAGQLYFPSTITMLCAQAGVIFGAGPTEEAAESSHSSGLSNIFERLDKQDAQHALLCDRLHKFWEYSHQRDQAIKRALQRNFTKPIPQFPDFPMDILGPWTATASPEDVPSEEESDN
ncbi:Retrotransposon gag protein [Melia azedarach]|uniref:Retrotransposon gag protein n=1 Tax=Melia azedarach TaxID=155640 RepID=A0ACC1X1R5_MELAZ|nr:Retrotransposon gag protein [Melia azedarach]